MNPSALVLASEAILSLYPILIRSVPTTLPTQWFARFLVFPVLAYLFASPRDIPSLPALFLQPSTLVAGILNLVHIGTSYLSFALLPAGIALSLFYTYPLFNVMAGSLFFGESLSITTLALLLPAMIGVWLLSREQTSTPPSTAPSPLPFPLGLSSLSPSTLGIIAALMAALTETLLYVFVRWTAMKKATSSPFTAILQLYPVGLLVLLIGVAYRPSALDLTPSSLLTLFGFNALVGFTGYATRFYIIPKVPTLVFSLLSFIGVLFGYVWGHWFTSDRITPTSLLGSGLIVISAFLARYQNGK